MLCCRDTYFTTKLLWTLSKAPLKSSQAWISKIQTIRFVKKIRRQKNSKIRTVTWTKTENRIKTTWKTRPNIPKSLFTLFQTCQTSKKILLEVIFFMKTKRSIFQENCQKLIFDFLIFSRHSGRGTSPWPCRSSTRACTSWPQAASAASTRLRCIWHKKVQ